jgi:hypothetical protein
LPLLLSLSLLLLFCCHPSRSGSAFVLVVALAVVFAFALALAFAFALAIVSAFALAVVFALAVAFAFAVASRYPKALALGLKITTSKGALAPGVCF